MYSLNIIRCNTRQVKNTVRRYFGSIRGTTAIEYATIASLLAIAITGAVWMVGNAVKSDYEAIASGIGPETAGPNNSPDPCRQGGVNCGGNGRGRGGERGERGGRGNK